MKRVSVRRAWMSGLGSSTTEDIYEGIKEVRELSHYLVLVTSNDQDIIIPLSFPVTEVKIEEE